MVALKNFTKSSSSAASSALFKTLQKDLETTKQLSIHELSPGYLRFQNDIGEVEYRITGQIPTQTWVRTIGNQDETLEKHLVWLEITAYEANGHFLPETPSPSDFPKIKRIVFRFRNHTPEEDRNHFVNNRVSGVDLDGDPANGVAKVQERTVELFIKSL